MRKGLKWIAVGLAGLFSLLIALIIALPFIIDPNDYKGQLEQLARKQGLDLQLAGDISWQLFPVLGLSVRDIHLAPVAEPEQNLAKIGEVTAAVAVMPLFRKQVQVEEILLAATTVQLKVDQNGRGNWQALLNDSESTPPPSPQTDESVTKAKLDLVAKRIRISNSTLNYSDQQSGGNTRVSITELSLSDANLAARAFPINLAASVENNALAKPLRLELSSFLRINEGLDVFIIQDAKLAAPDLALNLAFSAEAKNRDSLAYQLQMDAQLAKLASVFSALGIEAPITADPNVLQRARLKIDAEGSQRYINLAVSELALDDTTLQGKVGALFPNENMPLSLTVELQGDSFNADRYLPPPVENTNAAPTTATAATDTPLPIDALRALDGSFHIEMKELVVLEMPITAASLTVSGHEGVWRLNPLQATFYEGTIKSYAELDASQSRARWQWDANLNQVNVGKLAQTLAEFDALSGTVNAQVNAQGRAATTQELIANLAANVSFRGDNWQVQGLNIEQQYCRAIRYINGESTNSDRSEWPKHTVLNQVTGRITVNQSVATLESLQAQIAYLLLAAKGGVDLNKQQYQISMPLTLTREQTSERGCLAASDFFINREINVLGCNGDFNALDLAKQCGLRDGAVSDLAQQAVRYNLAKPKNQAKIEEKKEELDEKKQEVREKAKDKLRDLLNR